MFSTEHFVSYEHTLKKCLDKIGADRIFKRRKLIIIKPNLVNGSSFPITTSPQMIRELIRYIRMHSKARLVIAEGCGDCHLETPEIFARLGYEALAREYDVDLVDLNHEPVTRLKNPECKVFPEVFLPRVALKGFLISVPVLKAHSLANVTLAMKNMMGLAPPRYYQQGGMWKKAFFHERMHRSIFELNLYRKPDLSIIDASVGMAEYHLGGKTCDPPVNRIVAGLDPVRVDACGAGLLRLSWKDIPHISMADGILGKAEDESEHVVND
ncbi:MAG: DUF362 domain-containing protein [Desulfonatronovibrio sp. MSAO_Bac4]|nr:MAG: DUF362 domain-containing protein [Desulfonatronovibrio sp. MSAO_Bac4]